MKKILAIAVLSILILPVLGGVSMAAPANDNSGCKGSCIDTTKQKCSVAPTSGLCMSPEYRDNLSVQCCTGTVSALSSGGSGGSQGGSIEIPNPLKTKSIAELIDRIVNYIIGIATLIFPLIIIYGAWQFLSAGGDMEKVTTARKTITYAVIGYILILLSKGITMIVAQFLGVN